MNLIEVAFIGIIILGSTTLVVTLADEEPENILRINCDSGFKSPWSKTEVNILNSGQLFYTIDGLDTLYTTQRGEVCKEELLEVK